MRLMSEDVYIEAMGNGVSRKGFRALCKNLMVPLIEIGSGKYVDMVRFELAMTAITRIGQDNFFVPGCESIRNNSAKGRTTLDPAEVLDNYQVLVEELLAAKRVNGVEITRNVKETARKAAERMRDAALQNAPWKAQKTNEYSRNSRAKLSVQ